MKKLLFIILCLLCITGCGSEITEQEQPTNEQEQIEEKYLTVESTIKRTEQNGRIDTEILNVEIKNDEQGIFKNVSSDDLTKHYLPTIKEVASNNNLVLLPDYKHYLEEDAVISKIILKPQNEIISTDDKINLNENIVVWNWIQEAVQVKDKCATVYLDYYKDSDPYTFGGTGSAATDARLGMQTYNTCNIRSTQDRLDNLNEIKWVKYLDKEDEIAYEGESYEYTYDNIIISWLRPLDYEHHIDSRFKQYEIIDIGKELVEKAHLVSNGGNVGDEYYTKYNQKKYFILDEQACEEYNLVCDRW